MSKRVVALFLFVPSAFAFVACNDLIGNAPATLAASDAGTQETMGTVPTGDDGNAAQQDTTPDASMTPSDAGTIMQADSGGCAPGEKSCDGTCVPTNDPAYGCASAACTPCTVQRGTAVCAAGTCAVGTCNAGYSDCNGMIADGCETDLSKPTSCGTCNATCGALAPNCAPVGPSFQCTTGCPADSPLLCGAQCVDPTTSPAHCGGCNTACPMPTNGTATCANGMCGLTCNPQFHACPTNVCARDTDPNACGPTCAVCPKPTNATATCVANACAFTCATGTADCDKMPANGCEATLASDPMNCGGCGIVCPSTCTKGKCDMAQPDSGGGGGGDASAEGGGG